MRNITHEYKIFFKEILHSIYIDFLNTIKNLKDEKKRKELFFKALKNLSLKLLSILIYAISMYILIYLKENLFALENFSILTGIYFSIVIMIISLGIGFSYISIFTRPLLFIIHLLSVNHIFIILTE